MGNIPKITLDEIDEALNIYDSMYHTGNETLDAVLIENSINKEIPARTCWQKAFSVKDECFFVMSES